MGWQLPLVLLLVAVAAGYLLRQMWRTWMGDKAGGCGGGCRCDKQTGTSKGVTLIPPEHLRLRRRTPGAP